MEKRIVTTAPAEAQIRTRIDDWARALRAKDINGIMAHYAPDVLSFDCHSRLQLKGRMRWPSATT